MNINSIFISKGLVKVPTVKVINTDNDSKKGNGPSISYEQLMENAHYALMIQTELMRYGYILSPEAFEGVKLMIESEQAILAKDIADYFKMLYGDGQYTTLFGDYPNTVLSMDETEWLVKQSVHYWSSFFKDLGFVDEIYNPNPGDQNDSEHVGKSSLSVCCRDEYKIIEAGDADKLADIIKTLVCSEQSLTDFDKDVVKTFYSNIDDNTIGLSPTKRLEMLNLDVPFKETLCIVASVSNAFNIKDINDVLRIATYLSGGDISLAPIPKVVDEGWRKRPLTKDEKSKYYFKHFSNFEKRLLLGAIEDVASNKTVTNVLADMKKYLGRWVRLGEILHPGTEKNKKTYPNTYEVYDCLRNNPKAIVTWASKVEMYKKNRDYWKLIKEMSYRPGEFFRQLDYLIRTYDSDECVNNTLTVLATLIPECKTKMIYELLDHFCVRKENQTSRTVVIKSARRPVSLPLLEGLGDDLVNKIQSIILTELCKRFKESVDKNYGDLTDANITISSEVDGIMLPKNMRSANLAVTQVARGTRIPLPENCKCLRFFLHWTDEFGHEDLDLSAALYSESFDQSQNVGWNTQLRVAMNGKLEYHNNGYYGRIDDPSSETAIVFSGDVRNRVGNNAEYIDVDIDKVAHAGYRYILLNAHDYNAHSFKTGYVGYMARKEFGTPGEITWAPSTVENCIKIGSTTQNVILGIVDTFERKFIYVDEDATGIPVGSTLKNHYLSLIDRYTSSRFFSAGSLLMTYFMMSDIDSNNIKFLSDKEVKDFKKKNDEKIQDLTAKKISTEIELKKVLSKLEDPSVENVIDLKRQKERYEIEDAALTNEIKKLSKNLYFTFDDMSNYASIMKFMFN